MKFRLSSTALLSRLQIMSRVVAAKSTVPILSSLLLQWDEKKLSIAASDGEVLLKTWLPLEEVDESGAICVDMRILLNGIKGLSEQPILFDINPGNDEVYVHYESGVFHFIGSPGDLYPTERPLAEDAFHTEIDAPSLLRMVSKTIFATSTDEFRPTMTGIFFEMAEDSYNAVATDGQKLVVLRRLNQTTDIKRSFIMSRKSAALLKLLLSGLSGSVALAYDTNRMHLSMEEYELYAVLVPGKYPNFRAVMPKECASKVKLDRVSFLSLTRRVSCFSNSDSNLIKLNFDKGKVQVAAQDFGESMSGNEEISCDYQGKPFSIGFKASFLLEVLSNIDTPEVVLEMNSPSQPVLLLPTVNEEQEELRQLLMPLSVLE